MQSSSRDLRQSSAVLLDWKRVRYVA